MESEVPVQFTCLVVLSLVINEIWLLESPRKNMRLPLSRETDHTYSSESSDSSDDDEIFEPEEASKPLFYFYPTFSSGHSEQQDKSLIMDNGSKEKKEEPKSIRMSLTREEESISSQHDNHLTSTIHHKNTTKTIWQPAGWKDSIKIDFIPKQQRNDHSIVIVSRSMNFLSRRELSFEEWRTVASFLTKSVAFQSLAGVNRTSRLAVLSLFFVQNQKCIEWFVVRWMKTEKSNLRGENSLLPNDRLKDMLHLLYDCNLFDLKSHVHPEERMHSQEDTPIPNYYSITILEWACHYGFYSFIDQLIENPFLLPSISISERNHCLDMAFSNTNDETAKRMIKLYIRRISVKKSSPILISDILQHCSESKTPGIVIDVYSFLQRELRKAAFSEKDVTNMLNASIDEFFYEDHFVKLLKKKDFESALFVLQKYLTLKYDKKKKGINDPSLFFLSNCFKVILTFTFDVELMLWLLNTLSCELTHYVENPNAIISEIAHDYMLIANTGLYCEYIRKYSHRDEQKDRELVESSLGKLYSSYCSDVFSLIVPSFTAFKRALQSAEAKTNLLLSIFEPWLSEHYPEELATLLYNTSSILESGDKRYTNPECNYVKKLFNSRVQIKLAELFLAENKTDWPQLMFWIQRYQFLSDFYQPFLKKLQTDDSWLNQLYDHIISTILHSSNLNMMKNHLLGVDEEDHSSYEEYMDDDGKKKLLENRLIFFNEVYTTAAVLMYLGKLGLSKLFQLVAEYKADVINRFPQTFPFEYKSISDMRNIDRVDLQKDFQLVSHSTTLLTFILQHSVLRKYLNLLASLWPTFPLQENSSNTCKETKYFFKECDRCNPDIFSVLSAYHLREQDMTELIKFVLPRSMTDLHSFIHLDAFTTDHLMQIPSSSLFHASNLTHIRDVCKIVDLLWNNFEKDTTKFREFFCEIHSYKDIYDHLTAVLKYHKKYLEMAEEIMYDMLLCDGYYDPISLFKLRLTSTCSTQEKTIFMKLYGLNDLECEPDFKLRDSNRVIHVLKNKINNQQQETKIWSVWKIFIQQVTSKEIENEVSQLLSKIQPFRHLAFGDSKKQMSTPNTLPRERVTTTEKPPTFQLTFDFSKNPFASNSGTNFVFNPFSSNK